MLVTDRRCGLWQVVGVNVIIVDVVVVVVVYGISSGGVVWNH